ncbi:hypothetical protein, partial [Staphylococcus aureus]|uniref:hypothetical protein n=1 Tax=Staphylococcus aureus TaxID=1280 RepID=UPI001CB816C8
QAAEIFAASFKLDKSLKYLRHERVHLRSLFFIQFSRVARLPLLFFANFEEGAHESSNLY